MAEDRKLRIGVLASGGGSNLQSIIDQCQQQQIDAEIVLVLCNNPGAGALLRAEAAELPNCCINHRDFSDRQSFDQAVVARLQQSEVDLVVLAGFMRLISDRFLEAFPQRIINIHPSLLPAFPGLHVQQKALDYGARFSGCTVHFVDSGVDTGPIIAQAVVPIFPEDNEASLSARILQQEHKLYPHAIQLIASGRINIEDRQVNIAGTRNTETALLNPPLD